MAFRSRPADATGMVRAGVRAPTTATNARGSLRRGIAAGVVLLLLPLPGLANWQVITRALANGGADVPVAQIRNAQGYLLDVYRDAVGAVRTRFTLRDGLVRFTDRHCPTIQVDQRAAVNRSSNDAPCLAANTWAEYVLGHIVESRIESPRLLQFMNGNNVTVRFRLDSGEYHETSFSLAGSKRSLTAALGEDVVVVGG